MAKNFKKFIPLFKLVADSQHISETLLRRAEGIIERAKEELHRLHGIGRGHLVTELEYEIQKVEELAAELRTIPHDSIMDLHHIHLIEEALLKHENRLSEEVRRINAYDENGVRL
jgi:hypothetical protein